MEEIDNFREIVMMGEIGGNQEMSDRETETRIQRTPKPPPRISSGPLLIKTELQVKRREGSHTLPPEPNGYLHIGHAKSICLNFGIAAEYNGLCNLRFDDTNPIKEEIEYIQSIKDDIRWLGFDWEEREYYASDYFEQLYEWAKLLNKKRKSFCL